MIYNYDITGIYHLVGGIPTPLKKMSSSVGMIIPNIWENNPNVPNHQPVIVAGCGPIPMLCASAFGWRHGQWATSQTNQHMYVKHPQVDRRRMKRHKLALPIYDIIGHSLA